MTRTSVEIRTDIVEAVRLDLVGPDNRHAFARELIPDPPQRWYLTGFLVPSGAPSEQRLDKQSDDQIDSGGDTGGLDDAPAPDKAATKSFLPSSMGLSVIVGPETRTVRVTAEWGDYVYEGRGGEEESESHHEDHSDNPAGAVVDDDIDVEGVEEPRTQYGEGGVPAKQIRGYRRTPREGTATIALPPAGSKAAKTPVPGDDGMEFVVTVRDIPATARGAGRMPAGARAVSVFLVNNRAASLQGAYKAFAFQATMTISTDQPLVPRPDLRAAGGSILSDEWDERVADLQYRDAVEYAVGHGVSAIWTRDGNNSCSKVHTTWMPRAQVERVEPSKIPTVELRMEELANLMDSADARAKLTPMVSQYQAWIDAQESKVKGLSPDRAKTGEEMLELARYAARRIQQGIDDLATFEVLRAFKIANAAMGKAARQRFAAILGKQPDQVDAPAWRPFQLAFVLMAMRGIHDPQCSERETVDLLFFPTGGGKTEAYLGLAAFTLVLRRLRTPGIRSAGLSVLMRYTLRLLTLDQLGRATALMCALELEREKAPDLGEWPFEIGLWVGSAATPNRMGARGYKGPGKDDTAYIKTRRFKQASRNNPAPIPLENCPWCGTKFEPNSFRLTPSEINPIDLRVHCVNYKCEFSGNRNLPIIAVDEPTYRRLPAFIIATVDKFASLPWTGATGALFGLVDRYDTNGFYGPATPGTGQPLGGHLPPPDLIIQDELHLISGPLGTVAGIYETAIDTLTTREMDGKRYRPKIVASTATVRRAVPPDSRAV